MIDTKNMIDVTGVNLSALLIDAYDLSVPKGLGFLHYDPAPLTGDEADKIVAHFKKDKQFALIVDYLKGRAVKFHVRREGNRLYLDAQWFDHNDDAYAELLGRHGFKLETLR